MPLIAHSALPSFARLKQEGQDVLSPAQAPKNMRKLHIGFLNMMPDAALQATERQFLRLVGACNHSTQFYVYPFTFAEIPRAAAARTHIQKYYCDFAQLQQQGLDALIISGANPLQVDITQEPFWQPLTQVVHFASEHVCSVMCSCLATHAIVQLLWNIQRYPLPQKRWGVYTHRCAQSHPLTANINTRFDAPHSRLYEVNATQFQEAGLLVLAKSAQADLHLGVSPDGFRFVFFQGHPEYDAISLLKEYRREVARFVDGDRAQYPPLPKNYFHSTAFRLLREYKQLVLEAEGDYRHLPQFPEVEISNWVDNTWGDSGKAIVNNWLELICQLTPSERGKVFKQGIRSQDSLGLASEIPRLLK